MTAVATAEALAWSFGVLSLFLIGLLLVAVFGNAELAEENRRLRRALRAEHINHPSTRRITR